MRFWKHITKKNFTVLAATIAVLCVGAWASAVELRLRSDAQIDKWIIELSDVVDVVGGTADERAQLSRRLAIVPYTPGKSQTLSRREIADRLERGGLGYLDIRWSGASQVVVRRPSKRGGLRQPKQEFITLGHTTPVKQRSARGSDSQDSSRAAEPRVTKLIRDYLKLEANAKIDWRVSLKLSRSQAGDLDGQEVLSIDGGESPWVGRQKFYLTTADGIVSVLAKISRPQWVVKTTRPIPRGETILAADVELAERVDDGGRAVQAVYLSVENLVGMQATSALKEGQIVAKRDVKPPVYVFRGPVNLIAQVGMLQLTEEAQAKKDGRLGELIEVEVVRNGKKERLRAKVSGPQEVKIFARGASIPTRVRPAPQGPVSSYASRHQVTVQKLDSKPNTQSADKKADADQWRASPKSIRVTRKVRR